MDLALITPVVQADIDGILSLAQAKAEIRIETTDEDSVIQDAIYAAFEYFDGRNGWLRRAVLPQQWSYYRFDFSEPFEIPLPPLVSVDEVAYRDDTGTWQTIDPSIYEVDTSGLFGRITLVYQQAWPVAIRRRQCVRVNFTAGYDSPAKASTIPNPVPLGITRGMKLLVGAFFNNREASFDDGRVGTISRKISYGIEAVAGRYRIPNDVIDNFGDHELRIGPFSSFGWLWDRTN